MTPLALARKMFQKECYVYEGRGGKPARSTRVVSLEEAFQLKLPVMASPDIRRLFVHRFSHIEAADFLLGEYEGMSGTEAYPVMVVMREHVYIYTATVVDAPAPLADECPIPWMLKPWSEVDVDQTGFEYPLPTLDGRITAKAAGTLLTP